jgi:hypothetical protein
MSALSDLGMPQDTLSQHMGLARWVAYFSLFDLLVLPYFQLVILPLSLPLLLLALLVLDTRIRNDSYLFLFGVVIASAVLSVGAGYFVNDSSEYLAENTKRLFQLFTTFFYFFYFRWVARRVPLDVRPVLRVFLVWLWILSIAFVVRPGLTGDLIRIVYGRLVTAEDTLAEHLRFAYLFTDPNTAGYFLLVAAAGMLMTARTLRSQLTTLAILAPLVFITQSRGALFIYVLVAIATIYPPRRLAKTLLSVRRAGIVLFVVVGLVGLLIYLKQSGNEQFEVARMAYERLFEASSEQYATGGARLYVWERFFTSHLPLPLGRGYVLDVAGVVQGTHTDVLRITYSYGLIALVAIMMFFFRRLLSFPVLILPALMAFLINSLIDEQKLMALFLALLGICIGSEERLKATLTGAPHAQ